MEQLKPAAPAANDDGACAQAYGDFFHKIKADIAFDRWRAIWGFMRRRQAEANAPAQAELERLAELGSAVEKSAGPLKEGHELVFLQIQSAMAHEAVLANLGRLVEAISAGQSVVVTIGPEGERMRAVAQLVSEKFASGNDMPVERITLTRDEIGLPPLEALQ